MPRRLSVDFWQAAFPADSGAIWAWSCIHSCTLFWGRHPSGCLHVGQPDMSIWLLKSRSVVPLWVMLRCSRAWSTNAASRWCSTHHTCALPPPLRSGTCQSAAAPRLLSPAIPLHTNHIARLNTFCRFSRHHFSRTAPRRCRGHIGVQDAVRRGLTPSMQSERI